MNDQDRRSTAESDSPINSWEERLRRLDDRLRAMGHTVTVREGSDSTHYVASIPQGRKPRQK